MNHRKLVSIVIAVLVAGIFLGIQYRLNMGLEVDIQKITIETLLTAFLLIWISYSWEMNNKTYTFGLILIAVSFLADTLDEFSSPLYTDLVETIMEDYLLVLGFVITSLGVQSGYNKRKKEILNISKMAYFDQLTALPNRNGFKETLEAFIDEEKKFALLSVDFDNFKMINDVYGQDFGDRLLKVTSKGLRKILTSDSIIARVAADEFLCAIPLQEAEKCQAIVSSIVSNFDEVYTLDDIQIHLTASVGVALYPNHGNDVDSLIKKGNLALYHIKENGKNAYKIYDETIETEYENELDIKVKLLTAFEHNELYVNYQPIIDVVTGEIASYEALCRWELDGQLVPPDVFIPIAEKYGMVQRIDYYMLEQVCRSLSRLDVGEEDYPKISINLSPLSMVEKELTKHIELIVERYDVPFDRISFEITETAMMNNVLDTLEKVNDLFHLGFSVKLDDFGTGYSSLNHLRDLPISVLKIDKSFVQSITENDEARVFIGAFIKFLKAINVSMVAEGVETESQYDLLRHFDCDMIQGYYFSKPYTFDQVEKNIMK